MLGADLLDEDNITIPYEAVEWARNRELFYLENATNYRWGGDDDPQLSAYNSFKKQMKDNPVGVSQRWVAYLIFLPALISVASFFNGSEPTIIFTILLIITLLIFGFFFAINSSLHSYLILLFSPKERVNMNVGFYYMANAAGRLIGTFLSGLSYIFGGLTMCMIVSASMLFLAWYFTNKMVRSGNSRNKII